MKLFLLSALAFVVVSTAVFAQQSVRIEEPTSNAPSLDLVTEVKALSPTSLIPVLENEAFPIVSAQGAIAVDVNSAVVMYEKNPDEPMLPASTTKMMTALVAHEYFAPHDILTVPEGLRIEGQRMHLTPGEQMTARDVVKALLVFSANDAAEVIAANYPGGRDLFVEAMNLKAQEIGLRKTNFTNPSGLDDPAHVSTARDMVRLAIYALEDPVFAEIVATPSVQVENTTGKVYSLENTNELLGAVEGVRGIKTGWTENARENLVTYIERDGHKIVIAVLGSQDRFGETTELINWLYGSYEWEELQSVYPFVDENE